MNLIIIIWLFIGLISWGFTYHSSRKRWYKTFGHDYWKSEYKLTMILLCILSPYWLIGGLLSLVYWMIVTEKQDWSFYFNIKQYERKLLNAFRNEQK